MRRGRSTVARVLTRLCLVTLLVVIAALPSHTSPDSVASGVVSIDVESGVRHAVIESSPESTAALRTCRDWALVDCWIHPGGARYLQPGQDTLRAFGWDDADGVWIDAGCSLDVGGAGIGRPVGGPRWFKITGLFGLTHELRYTC